jgi:hypothetical protein
MVNIFLSVDQATSTGSGCGRARKVGQQGFNPVGLKRMVPVAENLGSSSSSRKRAIL